MSCDNGTGVGAKETVCDDGLDNDGDGDVDCADVDCADDPACATEIDCADATDNDGDALTDCDDPDCFDDPACATQDEVCTDGVDNDQDGDTDCADSDCASDPNCTGATEQVCDDSFDNDGDGDVDCADADCRFDAACAGQVELNCSDGQDDDGDGLTDCEDPDCANDVACGGSGLTCGQVLSCDESCGSDFQCIRSCEQQGCGTAQSLSRDLMSCVMMSCSSECQAGLGDPTCSACVAANCSDELAACQADDCSAPPVEVCDNGTDDDGDGAVDCDDSDCAAAPYCMGTDLTCSEVLTCAQSCPGTDYTCLQNCQNQGCPSAQQLSQDLVTCAGSACWQPCMNGLSDPACMQCVNASCGSELAACYADTCAPVPEDCGNGLDDDQDGDIDCADADCATDPLCSGGAEDCANGVDDDGDGAVDCLDSDCIATPGCQVVAETVCDDGADNDQDGATDCLDSDCANAPACGGGGWTCGEVYACVQNCGTDTNCAQACQNDGCASAQTLSQMVLDCAVNACAFNCLGGLGDPACQSCVAQACPDEVNACLADDCSGNIPEICDNGTDDDGDGDVDCNDADCVNDPACNTNGASTCGDILTCVQGCPQNDTTCRDACVQDGCPTAQSQFNTLGICVGTYCSAECSGGNQTQCGICIYQNCNAELQACQNGTCP